jgi:hypothetical protein
LTHNAIIQCLSHSHTLGEKGEGREERRERVREKREEDRAKREERA